MRNEVCLFLKQVLLYKFSFQCVTYVPLLRMLLEIIAIYLIFSIWYHIFMAEIRANTPIRLKTAVYSLNLWLTEISNQRWQGIVS